MQSMVTLPLMVEGVREGLSLAEAEETCTEQSEWLIVWCRATDSDLLLCRRGSFCVLLTVTVWRGFGLRKKSNRKPILGCSDRTTVKLDIDGELFRKVKYWAERTYKHFRLSGYVILKSSRDHYHVLFNRTVCWEENTKIMAWVAVLSRNAGLRKWVLMQLIKGASTLRVSSGLWLRKMSQ